MAWGGPKAAISRADLARECLEELHMWPGCESVVSVAVLSAASDRFTLHVVEYGTAPKKLADRALRCIEREKLRFYSLKAD
jgi:hypothetical protein